MSDHPHDPDQPLATRHGPEHALERLIFFSDAVFAIAITLLVIEIQVPHLPPGSGDAAFLNALLELIPNFIGFIISFFVIGAFWGGHHRAFGCAAHWHDRLMAPNIQMLLAIAAMPFFTAFMSEYSNQRVPVVAYCLWLLVTALLNVRLQRAATNAPVVDESVSAEAIHRIRLRGWATVGGAVTAVVVALVSPIPFAAQASLLTIPLWRLVLTRAIRQKTA
ncbi:MAG: DUF1211 domain-containing protein [Sphingomonas sp.]|nr:DUF1211 domain-containing protein [Sphingomonas sp.]